MWEVEEPEAWNRKLGHAWARVLRRQRASSNSTVVEIGPGFTDKVGIGLAELGFRGTVIIVEPHRAARSWTSRRYRQLLPRAEVLATGIPVPDASFLFGRSVDLLVANHILDDLLLNASVPPPEGARLFAQMGPGEACSRRFVNIWQQMLRAPERLEQLTVRVVEDFVRYIAAVQPDLAVLSQYPSWRHRRHGLEAIHAQSLRMMRLLATDLGTNRLAGGTVQWLVGTAKGG